jgi:hypothetical protein
LLTVVSRRDTGLVLKKEGGTTAMKKRLILVIAAMAAVLVMASGVALAIDQAKASPTKEKTTQKEEKTTAKTPATTASKGQQQLNLIQCPNQSGSKTCIGTKKGDRLEGTGEFERIEGRGGNDTYEGKDGGDDYFDNSKESNDTYVIPDTEFSLPAGHGGINITDHSGSSDVLDLSAYSSTEFTLTRTDFDGGGGNLLEMEGPGARGIGISDFFSKNTIDSFKFSDTTLTAKQMKERVRRV